jgi:hypothetical protein
MSSPTAPLPSRRGRPVGAASSLGTIRARIAELESIVADPERFLPGLSDDARITQTNSNKAQLDRLRAMAQAKASTAPTSPDSRATMNLRRAAAAEPFRIFGTLRATLLAFCDDARGRAKLASTQFHLPTDIAEFEADLTRMVSAIQTARIQLAERCSANFVMLYGDPQKDTADDDVAHFDGADEVDS